MAWGRFTADYNHAPKGARWSYGYKRGGRYSLKRERLDDAIAQGKAQAFANPPRHIAAALKQNPFWTGDHGTEIPR